MDEDLKHRSFYPLSVDCVIFGFADNKLNVALIQRKKEPFKNHWAIPGGFIEESETLEQGAQRELLEETNIKNVFLEQVHIFSKPNRDPRGRVISCAFYALVNPKAFNILAGQDASHVKWWPINKLPKLAFDHKLIFDTSLEKLRQSIRIKPIGFELLEEKFTLTEFQKLYEAILDKKIDKRNFRKKAAKMEFIKDSNEITSGKKARPAKLYLFDPVVYKKHSQNGFYFDL